MRRFAVSILSACLSISGTQAEILLAWPLACDIGRSCEIQHYVDHGSGASAEDYSCGTATYKGHNGTDIRVPTASGEVGRSEVLAAAPGQVLRVRGDMADDASQAGREAARGRECGNGLAIAHADGFETQYCHLAKDSLAVKAGDRVSAGATLGRIGLSGDTEFPHLHFTVRRHGRVIDPFAFERTDGACGSGASLWEPTLRPSLNYKVGTVLNAGFASRRVTMDAIENGIGQDPLTSDTPIIVAFARAITLRAGDVQTLVLSGPDGQLASHTLPPLASNKAQSFMEVGRRKPAGDWPLGEYSATYVVTRDGKVAMEKTFSTRLAPKAP